MASVTLTFRWPQWFKAWLRLTDEMYPPVALIWPKTVVAQYRVGDSGEWHDTEIDLILEPLED